VGLVVTETASAESKAAFDYLKSDKIYQPEYVVLSKVKNNFSGAVKKFQALWIHRADTSDFAAIEKDPKIISGLKAYVNGGGKLLLTLEAMRYLKLMGLEDEDPGVVSVSAFDEGYGRRLGLHSYRAHPIFSDFHGGAYIFSPYEDMMTRQLGYFEGSYPKGKTVAVDWSYITLREKNKIILEHELGKGKVLSIGSYTYYAIKNYNRAHLELFTKNCFQYLVGEKKGDTYFWTYETRGVKPFSSRARKINLPAGKAWDDHSESMTIKSRYGTSNYYDVAGQRILIMGKENGGVEEIWAHPFMPVRDYEVGILFNKKDSVYWLKNMRPEIEVKPESFTRLYQTRRAYIKEVITYDMEKPIGVLHYEFRGLTEAELVIKFKSNFRVMWPYSDSAFGSIHYDFNKDMNAYVLKDDSGDLNMILGADRQIDKNMMGRYVSIDKADSTFAGKETSKFFATGLFTIPLKYNDNLNVIISASNEGYDKTLEYYEYGINSSEKIYENTTAYTRGFLDKSMKITTPSADFNEGYKWALNATDRFFATTPGLGTSFHAGYGTSRSGWGGNQAVSGRPGYAWYFGRDAVWTSMAVLDYGDYDKVKQALKFFQQYQDVTGKIYHEVTTSGFIHYDASDATPLFIVLAGRYMRHSGDVEFIKESWPSIKKALEFCFSTDRDGDHLIEIFNVGHGWLEGGDLYGVNEEIYLASCWGEALKEASNMAKVIGLNEEAEKLAAESKLVVGMVNNDFWNEKTRHLNMGKFLDGTYNENMTVLPAVPMFFKHIDNTKANLTLSHIAHNDFSPNWGVRIVSEYNPMFRPTGYHYGSVWPLFTGWASLAEYGYGRDLPGYFHFMGTLLMYRNWGLGYVEEVINGLEYNPTGICRHQCWSETMGIQPAMEGMIGFKPDALEKGVELKPQLPADWDYINVENMRVGSAYMSFNMKRANGTTVYTFKNNGGALTVNFTPQVLPGMKVQSVRVNGQAVNAAGTYAIALNGEAKVEVAYEGGVKALPVYYNLKPGDGAVGLRMIGDSYDGNVYSVDMEYLSGGEEQFKVYSEKNIATKDAVQVAKEGNVYTYKVVFDKADAKYSVKHVSFTQN
jgi:glycogen debranching enzyme